MSVRVKLVTVEEVIVVHTTCRPKHGCSDKGTLERFIDRVRSNELDPDALLYLACLVEPGDVRFVEDIAVALDLMAKRYSDFEKSIRLRRSMNLQRLRVHVATLRSNFQNIRVAIGEELKRRMLLDFIEENAELRNALERLDRSNGLS